MEPLSAKEMEILLLLLKDCSGGYNANSISKRIDITPMGALKILKKLEKQGLLKSTKMGKAVFYRPVFENEYAEDLYAFILHKEAVESKPRVRMWVAETRKLRTNADAAIVFGSVLKDDEYGDVDLLLVLQPEKAAQLEADLEELNRINIKKVHAIKQTKEDLIRNIEVGDKRVLEALRKGVVAFGYKSVLEVLKDVSHRK